MTDHELDRDPVLNTEEQQALDSLLAEPELSAGEWDSLRDRIERACELPLARRRQAIRPRRAAVAKWLRPALPLAAAALLLIVLSTQLDLGTGDRQPGGELGVAERTLLADVSDAEFAQLVSGEADAAALLLMAVSEE